MNALRSLILAAVIGGVCLLGAGVASAHPGHGPGEFYGGYHGGYHGGYRNVYGGHWHNTPHWHYHPGGYQRHYNHFHYVPGHFHYHRDVAMVFSRRQLLETQLIVAL